MKFAKLVSIILSPLFLAAALFAAPDTTVQAAKNDVVVVVNGVASALKPGDIVPPGAVVKAGKGSAAQIKLPDGSLVGIGEGAEVRISVSEAGESSISLGSGTITVQSNAPKGSSVTILTSSGAVTGTRGVVTVTATASTATVTATSGNWRVTGTTGDTGVLGANQTVMVKKDDATFAPRPATKSEVAKAETTLSAEGAPGAETSVSKPAAAPEADSGAVDIEGNDINTNVTPNSPDLG